MSRTNNPESDVRVKTFQLQNPADEEAMNRFLAGKQVRYWEAKFTPGPSLPASEGAPIVMGLWNIFVAYQERDVEAHTAARRPAPTIKKHGAPVATMTPAEKADKRAEARKPVEAYKPSVPEHDVPLFEAIRTWRNTRAREERVKPFSFFNNFQLEQMVLAKPASSDALKAIATNMEPPLWDKYHKELLGFIDAARAATPAAGNGTTAPSTPTPVPQPAESL